LVGGSVYREVLPIGSEFWNATAVNLGADMPAHWLNAVTGENLDVASSGSSRSLPLSQVLNHFPVALLYQEQASTEATAREDSVHAAGVQHSA
jgi:maltooligosyltrehalose synthase